MFSYLTHLYLQVAACGQHALTNVRAMIFRLPRWLAGWCSLWNIQYAGLLVVSNNFWMILQRLPMIFGCFSDSLGDFPMFLLKPLTVMVGNKWWCIVERAGTRRKIEVITYQEIALPPQQRTVRTGALPMRWGAGQFDPCYFYPAEVMRHHLEIYKWRPPSLFTGAHLQLLPSERDLCFG